MQLLVYLNVAIAIAVGLITIIIRLRPLWQNYWDRRSLRRRLGAEIYSREEIWAATRYYIKPNCQDVDPTQEEEIRLVHGVQGDLFETVDRMLANPDKYKYVILLADSGMGKTSFLMNYYAYHWKSLRRHRKFNLALVALGIPNPDIHIEKVNDKQNTVLFLDAFDEDIQAIQDHLMRLKHLLDLSHEFRQVLITSRTQFFPREEEIPKETGIMKVTPTAAGETRDYVFYKIYLSPFSDDQVEKYIKRRFSFLRQNQRQKARDMVQKIPFLIVRPMLLAHIQELVKSGKEFLYSFQIYEEMVAAWLTRERSFVKDNDILRRFSEKLAMDLYQNREQRGAERVHFSELEPLAQSFNIKLQAWQLRNRSLLNRDAAGNYKFAHRSIMEYLIVKQFWETKPDSRPLIAWTEQMTKFISEMICHSYHLKSMLHFPDISRVDFRKLFSVQLRKTGDYISIEEIKQALENFNFYDSLRNKKGKGIQHLYFKLEDREQVVFDLKTCLMWQQGGSSRFITYDDAKNWIIEMNRDKFAGFDDWRLPTLEEAMSLMESKKKNGALYIDPVFDKIQKVIWTSDLVEGENWAWIVHYANGYCKNSKLSVYNYVRAVRSGQSSPE